MTKKKVTKKKTTPKKEVKRKTVTIKKEVRPSTEKILIDNFVSMQKVLVHLTEKFSDLTKRLDDMLNMFEGAAKSVIDKEFHPIDEKSKREIITKIDAILEQNKLLAKGITLMHDSASDSKVGYTIGSKSEINIPSKMNNNIPPKKNFVKEDTRPFNKFS